MASGISVQLPLAYDPTDGPYRLNKSVKDAVKQNVKTLFLTNKGCLLYTSPSPRDAHESRMPSSA